MKSSVCIEMIYTEYPFLERIEKAAEAGFDAIVTGFLFTIKKHFV